MEPNDFPGRPYSRNDPRRTAWGDLSDEMLGLLDATAYGSADDRWSTTAAQRIVMHGRRDGWSSALVAEQLQLLYATEKASGGYGLSRPWDAFQDGTVNSADTVYTVTTAGVGQVLLEGYRAGAVPRERLVSVVDALLRTSLSEVRVNGVTYGTCMAYSQSPNDTVTQASCIINVSLGAAAFLRSALDAGILTGDVPRTRRAEAVVALLSPLGMATYMPEKGGWGYQAGTMYVQDWNHNAYTFQSARVLYGDDAIRDGVRAALAAPRYIGGDPIPGESYDPMGRLFMQCLAIDASPQNAWGDAVYMRDLAKRLKVPTIFGQMAMATATLATYGGFAAQEWRATARVEVGVIDEVGRPLTSVARGTWVRVYARLTDAAGIANPGQTIRCVMVSGGVVLQDVSTLANFDGSTVLWLQPPAATVVWCAVAGSAARISGASATMTLATT